MTSTQEVQISDAEFEEYKFYRLYHIDLDEARHTLEVHRRCRSNAVRYGLLRSAVVAYARPFSSNRGMLHRKHSLTPKVVPASSKSLHAELVDLRMRLFAHTDLSFRKPQVAKWPTTSGKAVFPIGFAHGNLELLGRRAKDIRSLVSAVMQNLWAKIAVIHERLQ